MADVQLVSNIFQNMNLHDLLKCKDVLDSIVNHRYVLKDEEIKSKNPKDFVRYEECFLPNDSVQYAAVKAEVESLNMKKSSKSPSTKWLTSTDRAYCWKTSTGNTTVKEPVDLAQYKGINNLMNHINETFNTKLNSCLVSKYENGNIYTPYHDDAEDSLDQTESLFVVSLGVERSVDFIRQGDSYRSSAVYTLNPVDGSLYVMKTGCQQYFLHRLRRNYNSEVGSRFCLSFRRIKTEDEQPEVVEPRLSSPVKELINLYEGGIPESDIKLDDVSKYMSSKAYDNPPRKKRTTVIFGTSITKRLNPSQLSSPGRKVINVSQSGAKIKHVIENVEYFHKTNSMAGDIEKIIINVGTNDIKFSRRGIQHLKRYLIDLILKCKSLFPSSMVIFQCCLPIRNLYYYTVSNVLEFNKLLCRLCNEYNCIYVDCFRDFLDYEGTDQFKDLFHDWLHLNYEGLGVLAVWYKYIIKQDSFNEIII